MVDFGEELFIVDSFKIPWLVWIQMVVFCLILILFLAIVVFSTDLSDSNFTSSGSTAASTSGASVPRRLLPSDPVPTNRDSKFFVNSSLVQSNQLAGSAFLKCLGLDRTSSEDGRRPEPKKPR